MNLKAIETLESQAVDTPVPGDLAKPHTHGCGSHCHHDHGREELRNLPRSRSAPKIGRNDPCLCGSGKKYKKCCLA